MADFEIREKISPLLDQLTKNIMLDVLRGDEVEAACRLQYDQLIAAGLSDEVATAIIETVLVSYIEFKKGVVLVGFDTEPELVAAYKKSIGQDGITAQDIRDFKVERFATHIAAEYGLALSVESVWIRNFGYVKVVTNE